MLSSRLNAFVIPTSQRTPIAAARTSLPTISTERPVDEHDRRGAELRGELEPRGQRVDVVDQAGEEEQRGAAEDAEQLLAAVEAADRERRADPGGEPEEDADAAEGRGRVLAPALAGGVRDQPAAERGAEAAPRSRRR